MPPTRSFVWLYMEKISADRVACKLCGAQYTSSTGTSTMRKHIQIKHPEESEAAADYENSKEKHNPNRINELGGTCVSRRLSTTFKRDIVVGEDSNNDSDRDYNISNLRSNDSQNGGLICSGSKRKNASVIWHFMTKVALKEIKCLLCQRHFSFDGSTSNMHRHLRSDHPDELEELIRGGAITLPSSTASADQGKHEFEDNERLSFSKNLSFIVENGMTESDNLCAGNQDLQASFSKRDAQTCRLFDSENDIRVRKRTQWGFKRKNASIIWQFMVKTNPGETRCQLCGKEFRFEGSTSNMHKHVQREHPGELAQLSGEGSVKLPSNSTGTREPNGQRNEFGAFDKEFINPSPHGEDSTVEEENVSDSDPDYSPIKQTGSVKKKSPAKRPLARWKCGNIKQGKVMKRQAQWHLKRKNGSIIWRFMARVHPKGSMCQLCKKCFSFDGSTTNMHKHLKKDHPEELAVVLEGGTITLPFRSEDMMEAKQEIFPSENGRFTDEEIGHVNFHTRYFFGKKPTSLIWRFMERISPDKAVCQLCQKEFNYIGSTSNMRKHLKFSHSQEYSKGLSKGALSWNPPNALSSSVTAKSKTCMSGGVTKRLDTMVLMAVGNLYPCSLDLIESEGFLKFMYAINPNFLVPNKKTLEETILKLHRKYADVVQKQIEQAPGISISSEIWTYRDRQKYLTVTGHFVSDVWELQSVVLKTVSLDSSTDLNASIGNKLKQVFEEWNFLEKVKCIVSDNNENFSSAVRLMNKPYLQCIAKSLDLMIQESLKASNDIEYLIQRVRNISGFFLHSIEASKKLEELLISEGKLPVKLVLHPESDWIGTHKMFKIYMELHNTLGLVLNQINKEDILLVAEELELASRCIQVLEPFTLAAEDMIADNYTVLSKSLPLFDILRQMTANLVETDQSPSVTQLDSASGFIKELSGLVEKCLSVIADRNNFLPWAATLLDPRFKHIVMENPEMQRWVESELQRMIEPNKVTAENESQTVPKTNDAEANVSLLWSSFDESIKKSALEEPVDELQRYIEERPIKRQECPFKWWMEREHLYPKLCTVVKQFLCIPATAIPAKQIFSEKEKMKKILRNFLEEPYIDSFLFLNSCQKVKELNSLV